VARHDALWHERVRPPNTEDTLWHVLTLPGKEGQSPLNPKVQGSTPCASTIMFVQVRHPGDKTPSAAVRQTFGRLVTATSVPTRHSPAMREMSVTEPSYKASSR
jgi:hypothetical protein